MTNWVSVHLPSLRPNPPIFFSFPGKKKQYFQENHITASMLAFFTTPQTGQEIKKPWQDLHEQRCLQGRKTTHEFRELQHLHSIFLAFCSSFSPPLFSPVSSSQQDSASSTQLVKHWFSLSRSIELLRLETKASFSLASLCQFWLSISIVLKNCSSSPVLFMALEISSSFCFSKYSAFASNFLRSNKICCFLCSCKANFNLSFCNQNYRTSN